MVCGAQQLIVQEQLWEASVMVKQAELPIVEETSKQGREAECQRWRLGGSRSVDAAHADDPGDRSERRAMVQLD